MSFFAFHEQNWSNLMVLSASLCFSFFGTVVNNRFSAQRVHNITKLFNEALSRSNLAFMLFMTTLAILRANSEMARNVLWAASAFSALLWFVSLYVMEHISNNKVPVMHDCEIDPENQYRCKTMPSYSDLILISKWNIVIFAVLFLLALLAAFNRWTCGNTCVPTA